MTSKKNIYRFFYNATFLVIKRITDVLWNKIRWYRPIERVGKLRVISLSSFFFSLLLSGEGDTFFFPPPTTIPSCLPIVKFFFYEYFLFTHKYILTARKRSLICLHKIDWSYFLKNKNIVHFIFFFLIN